MIKEILKKQKGITLIALVVTIVVLLILAGVSISMLAGENGIINQAREAKKETEQAKEEESDILDNYIGVIDKNIPKEKEIKVNYAKTEGSNLWETTVTMNITLENIKELTFQQKKEIAAYLFDYSSYNELLAAMEVTDDVVTEEICDQIIEIGRAYIDYTDTAKLESLGIQIISVLTPYNNTLYTSNLGGAIKCTFTRNGTYEFRIKSGQTEKTEKITIDNLRTASTEGPYSVNVEVSKTVLGKNYFDNLLYSVDETNLWQKLENDKIIQCNNSISFKFNEENRLVYEGSTEGRGLHYVEKNDEYYKYFNAENPNHWLLIRYSYVIGYWLPYVVQQNGLTLKQYIIYNAFSNPSKKEMYLSDIYAKVPDFQKEYPKGFQNRIGGGNVDFPQEIAKKYPELDLGEDNVIYWYNTNEDSPVFKLDVTKDMSILVHTERWD